MEGERRRNGKDGGGRGWIKENNEHGRGQGGAAKERGGGRDWT